MRRLRLDARQDECLIWAHMDAFKQKVKAVFVSYGSRELSGDRAGRGGDPKANAEALKAAGVNSYFYVSPETAHEWQTWRRSLHQFAPLIFQDRPVQMAAAQLPAASVIAAAPAPAATAVATVKPATGQIIRIKAGAAAPVKDADGNTWLADQGFEGGATIERPDIQIANTKSPDLYRAEHYSMDSFSWPVPNGKYLVKLHFAETFDGITAAGERVFSFNVQGKDYNDFDVWAKAGGALKAYVESVPVEVADGKLKITFTPKAENPQICAIEIIPQSAVDAGAAVPAVKAIRIKAGASAPVKDADGNDWLADQGFEGGATIERPDIQIANTKSPDLYRSEHYSMDSFSWPVPNGKYLVKLHFAETFDGITAPGERVFSFNVQGKEFKDFDVWATPVAGVTGPPPLQDQRQVC